MKTENQEQHEVMRLIKGELPQEIVKRHHDNKVAEFSNRHGFSSPFERMFCTTRCAFHFGKDIGYMPGGIPQRGHQAPRHRSRTAGLRPGAFQCRGRMKGRRDSLCFGTGSSGNCHLILFITERS